MGKTKETQSIQCPKCERDWPLISEQGIHTELYDVCHACSVSQIVSIRDKRQTDADYEITDCPDCQGQTGLREKCVPCFSKGWITTPKTKNDKRNS